MDAPVGQCASCDDSPLSYTGNITGILTFGLGVVVSILGVYALTRGAFHEMHRVSNDLDRTSKQVFAFLEYCIDPLNDVSDSEVGLTASLKSLHSTIRDARDKLSGLKPFDRQSKNPFATQIRRRVQWVMKREEILDEMAKVSDRKAEVIAAQMILLLKYSILPDEMTLAHILFRKSSAQDKLAKEQLLLLRSIAKILNEAHSPQPNPTSTQVQL